MSDPMTPFIKPVKEICGGGIVISIIMDVANMI